MKKLSLIIKKLSLKKVALAMVSLIPGLLSASAETVNLGALEPGVEYSWPMYSTVSAQYTPTKTGPVRMVYTSVPLPLYSSPDYNENSEVYGAFNYADGHQIKSYAELQEGVTYYLYQAFTMNEGSLIIYEGAAELQLTSTVPSVNPEDQNYYGGRFSASKNYEMVVNFNFPITIGNTFVVAPDNSRVQVTTKCEGSSVGCDIAPALMELYHDGKLNEGDEVILRLLQVKDAADPDNKYNGNGRCEIKFNVAAKPLELVEIIGANRNQVDNPFYSYYLPGDETGCIHFVFDGDLATDRTGVANLEYGASDNLDVGMYYENIEATHEGNRATFDFTGKRRRPIDMLPASDANTQPENLYISFGNLFSPDGQRAYTGSKSNPTGYPMSFQIKVLQYTVVGDFTPMRGTELFFGQPMEIWVMNGDKIIYDTIRFEFTENGAPAYYDMPREEITEEPDPYSEGAMLYTFDIPTIPCDPGTPVVVRMTGLVCADGLDHSNDVYGEFTQASSGISDSFAADTLTFDVYDITGVRVLRNVSRDAISSLAKGIYLINGKKLVVR